MSTSPRRQESVPSGVHIATVAHEGRIWETWLLFENDPLRPTSYRARFRFDPPSGDPIGTVQTTVLIIEDSYEDAVAKARGFDDRALQGLLRSALPSTGDGILG